MENLHIEDPGWFNSANCASTDPEVMFPKRGDSSELAKSICARCVVVNDCLVSAIIEDDMARGIRGGMTAKERRAYARQVQ